MSDMLQLVVSCEGDFCGSQRQAKAYRTPRWENKMTDRRRFVKTLFCGGAGALLTTRSLIGQSPLREVNLINAALSYDQKTDTGLGLSKEPNRMEQIVIQ
jgi:hypothetical protein